MTDKRYNKSRVISAGLWLSLYGAVVLCALLSYFISYPLPEFANKLIAVASTCFLLLGCFCLGQCVWKFYPTSSTASSSESVSEIFLLLAKGGIGFGALGTTVLVTAWLMPGPLKFKLAILTVALCVLIYHVLTTRSLPKVSFSKLEFTLIETLGITVAAMGLLTTFISCFSPITYYDSLVYHLALPNLYNQAGRISAVPFNLYSCFPALTEMVYLYVLNQLPQTEYTINLLGWAISVAVSLGIAQWAHELGGKKLAIWAFALWWTMPAVMLLSVGAYVDIPLSGWIFLSVRSFSIAKRYDWSLRWLIVSGIFSGLAFATKYTGAICPILLLFLLAQSWVSQRTLAFRHIASFMVAFFVPISFWLLKNAIYIGNPFFPFCYKWLGGGVDWTQDTAAGYFMALTEYGAKSEIFYELLLAPFRLTTSNLSFGGGFDVLGDFGWPLLIFGAPVAFFFNKRQSVIRLLCTYALFHFLFWYFTKPVLRFLIGLLPVAVLLSAITFHHLTTRRGTWVRNITCFFVTLWILSNFFMYFFIANGLQPFHVAFGFETPEVYLTRRLNFYSTFEFANKHLGSEEKIYLLGEQRSYHLKRSFVGSNLFAESPIAHVCNSAHAVDDIADYFNKNSLTHLIVNEGEITRLGGLEKFGFNEKGKRMLGNFIAAKTEVLFENRAVILRHFIN